MSNPNVLVDSAPKHQLSRSLKGRHLTMISIGGIIGAEAALPEVSRVKMDGRGVFLLCSDGLTKHVKDHEIAAELKTLTSSEASCRRLLDLALERGGSDNITVLIARATNLGKAHKPA